MLDNSVDVLVTNLEEHATLGNFSQSDDRFTETHMQEMADN